MYLVDMNIMMCNICFYDMWHYNKVFELELFELYYMV